MSLTLNLPRPTSLVVLSPLPLASILDHHLRRSSTQDRVFGTLLGTKTETEIEVKACFGVPYEVVGEGQVTIDIDHHKSLLELHLRLNPKEVVVGWYATSPNLNSFSALIHNFYTSESTPTPALHLTLDPESLSFICYTAAPIGTLAKPDHLAFLPVESIIRVNEGERVGLDLLTSQITALSPAALTSNGEGRIPIQTPLETLSTLLAKVSFMLDSVLVYVQKVTKGEIAGNEKVGRALMETVGTASPFNAPGKVEGGEGEEAFNKNLADILMVSYLANLVKTQTEISSRLNLLV